MIKRFAETGIYKLAGVLFLIFFIPIALAVFFIGTDLNYYGDLKLETLLHNRILILLALPVFLLTIFLFRRSERRPLLGKRGYITDAWLVVLSVPVYLISLRIAKEIVFFLPWDVGIVRGTAYAIADREELGYFAYLSIYPNNIPISYLLGRLFRYAKENGIYGFNPEFIWVRTNCILMTLSILFMGLTVRRLTCNLAAVVGSFLLGVCLIGLSAWKVAPYTDTFSQLFPIMSIFFYLCFREKKHAAVRLILLAASVLAGAVGGWIKPNVYLIWIVILIAELRDLAAAEEKRKALGYFAATLVMIFIAFFATRLCTDHIIREIGLDYNKEVSAGAADYFFLGLNEEHTGAYNAEDAAIFGEFQFEKKSVREKAVFQRGLERIKERGFIGSVYFWLKKMTMTFDDGMFGWQNEVWLADYYDPPMDSGTRLTGVLRAALWEGKRVVQWNTIIQLIWLYCLMGITGICFCKKEERDTNFVLVLSFLGVFFYQLFFEARARYLFTFAPLLILIAVMGLDHYSRIVGGFWEKRKTQIKEAAKGKRTQESEA